MSYIPVIQDICQALKQLVAACVRPMWVNPTNSQVQVNIAAGTLPTVTTVGTCTTVTTVTTVTNLTQFSGYSTYYNQIVPHERTNWQACVRARIT